MWMLLSHFFFQRAEAYFLEAIFFDELVEDGEIAPIRPRGVPLLGWEDLKEQEQ